jgi:hypothetical protein
MTCQGSYYNSLPLLDVLQFRIIRDEHQVLAEGREGVIWVDYVVQSYDAKAKTIAATASWQFFAIQFPELESALMVSLVDTVQQGAHTKLPAAKYFQSPSGTTPNGALEARFEWGLDQISIEPVLSSAWTSPPPPRGSGLTYYLETRITLHAPPLNIRLTLTSVRDNQEIVIAGSDSTTAKYEGVFLVQGSIGSRRINGVAWGELVAAGHE